MRSLIITLAGVFLAGCVSEPPPNSTASRNADLIILAPRAAAVGLAEVAALREVDTRPADGDLAIVAELRFVKSSGEVPRKIHIVKEYGGLRPPGAEPIEKVSLPGPVRPGSLVEGRRYWFAFSSQYEYASGKYPQQVVGFWEEDAEEAQVFEDAAAEDRFAWNPQYDPATGLTHSDRSSPEKKEWTIRVHKDDKLLWETTRRGVKAERYMSFGFFPAAGLEREQPVLLAEAAVSLAADNEYGLPAGEYYLKHGYDATSGRIPATWVSTFQGGYAERVFRTYDEEGRLRREERSDFLSDGGIAAGGETEAWLRKIVRTYGPEGEIESEKVLRHGKDENGASAWIKVAM